jgi:cyclopropane-fatty-acyl-phospholipid synthase
VSPLLSVVKAKLQSLSVSMQLVLADGVRVGPDDAAVRLTARNKVALTYLAAGEVGVLGQDYVEGHIDIEGNMRDVMCVSAALLPGFPVDAVGVAPFD